MSSQAPTIYLQEAQLDRGFAPPPGAHVYLYFEAPCRQACQFCQQPAQRRQPGNRTYALALAREHERGTDLVGSGAFGALLDRLGDGGGALTIHGHDWAMHPRLEQLLHRLERETRVPIALLGPSTALADPAIAARVATIKTLRRITLTLLSADPARHDAIAGAPGAGAQVLAAIENLRAHGVKPIVNVVLTADVVLGLADLLALLDGRGLRAALLGFVPEPGPAPLAHLLAPASAIRAVLERDEARARRVIDSAAGLALCALPRSLRARASSAWPGRRCVFTEACETCEDKGGCAGVPLEYRERFGSAGLTPSRAAAR